MKLPELYRDWKIVGGILLTLLGAGNWLIGTVNTDRFNTAQAASHPRGLDSVYRGFEELDPNSDRAVLEPLIAQQRNVTYAAAHVDFYHATVLTGRVLFGVGLAFTLFAFLAAIRRDSRRALPHIGAATTDGRDQG